MSLKAKRAVSLSSKKRFCIAIFNDPILLVSYVPPHTEGELYHPDSSALKPLGSLKVF